MTVCTLDIRPSSLRQVTLGIVLMLLMSLSPALIHLGPTARMETGGGTTEPWTDGGQPWPQSGRTPDRMADAPAHAPDGGAGVGTPSDAPELRSVVDPAVNWMYGSYSIGTDALATPVADLSASVTKDEGAAERCGGNSLYTILIQTDENSDHTYLRIVEGEDADLAWEVDMGLTDYVKAAPVVVDVDDDGIQEVLVAYDASGTLYLDAWSPQLSCSVTGWSTSGDSSQLLWSWSDEGLMISGEATSFTNGLGGHRPTTQPLLADLDLDGDAEMVIAAIDEVSDKPVVVALGLSDTGANLLWEVPLDRGSHPSDPAFAQTDPTTGYVLLTTTQESSGAMWVWKLDSDTGDSNWDTKTLGNSDGDSSAPHIRLPGPIIAELNGVSDDLEMILTIPTDFDGSNGQDGAEFVGMEIGTGDELWSFEASNGYADAPPVAIDTNGDGQHDRVCWVTWSQETTGARHGHAGCHDVSGSSPNQVWQEPLEQSSGTPNDEIAVAPPTWMDIDGSGEQELLVAYGRSLWALDGEDGSPVSIWGSSIELPHRTWSAPALADVDGDAMLDIVLGDTVVSHALADVRPLLDQRSIEFSPSEPDPGEAVTVTALFENSGTADTDHETEAKLYANGQLIASYEAGTMEPVDPTGSGSFESFSVEWSGSLGEHVFELVLDPHSNVSQSRLDNDAQIATFSIVAPYNATFEMPTEPIRVTPGETSLATPNVRSTGRLSGTWSLAVDDASLPEGWSWSDETSGGLTGVDIGVDAVWSPELRIHAPADTLGSDAGHLGLTLSLDEDPENVSVSASLPVEANRTRGLSLRGPDGTALSTGYGLLGTDAQAWMLLHNLGNANEVISYSWQNTSWGNIGIYDMEGIEQPALSLSAREVKLLTARLEVPGNANLGESVSTHLTMCVGSDDEQTCQTISLTFEASGVVTDVHQRSVPASGLSWEVRADMPSAASELTWSLSDAGMVIQGWSWSASGDLSIVGDSIVMSGASWPEQASGTLTLDLPSDAPPAFHSFSDASDQSSDHVITLSLEVLQIHRASIVVTSPTEQPHVVEVGEESLVMVRLENQGNGQDTYRLSHEVVIDENVTEDPGVTVSFSNDMVSLEAGSLTNIPVTVVLPANTPAGTPLDVMFQMTSMGNQVVSDSDSVSLEARQDHRWDLVASVAGSEVDGRTFAIVPGEGLSIEVNATNVGNLIDGLELTVVYSVSPVDGDSSQNWTVGGDSVSGIEVNQSAQMTVHASISEGAWNGSVMSVNVTAEAQGEVMGSFDFDVEASHVPGWSVAADQANLEVGPEGSSVALEVIQLGNSPSEPYATVWVSGEGGWEVETPEELSVLSPGQTAPMILNITPPETAQHGRAVELHVRLREGDGSGLTEITLPLRVAVLHDFNMSGDGDWQVSDQGGHPLAELHNLGNAPTTISLQILSLPLGWTVSGETDVVLGVGEIRGVPIEVIPSADWDGSVHTIRILANDSVGNQREVSLDTEQLAYSWASSPIVVAMSGDYAIVRIHGTDASSTVIDSASGQLSWHDSGGWTLPAMSSGTGSLSVGGSALVYYAHVTQPSLRDADCSIQGELVAVVAQCSVLNGTDSFSFTVLLVDDQGVMLDSFSGSTAGGSGTSPINLSAETWNPEPGMRVLTLRLLDGRGVEIAAADGAFEVRRTDWNIGLVGLELDGEGTEQKIRVLTKRGDGVGAMFDQYDADCTLDLVSGDYSMTHRVDLTGTFSPTVEIDRPGSVQNGDEIVVTIGCAFPWDVDSDPSDDESRIILSGDRTDPIKYTDIGTSLAAALLVIGVSVALTWMVRNYREGKELMEMAMAAAEEKMVEKKVDREVVEEEEDLSDEEEEEGVQTPESDSESPAEDDFEARLKRLMRD